MSVQFPVTIFLKYMYIGADQTARKEIIISIFIAGSSLIMATPRKIYDTVSKTIILNMFKYFKDESLKFPPNHPQRSYLKKTVTGLNHRTISWICQSARRRRQVRLQHRCQSLQHQHCQLRPMQLRLRQHHLQLESTLQSYILDDCDKCVRRRTIQEIYTVRKQLPTIAKLLVVLRVEINFNGCRDTLRKIVRTLGFRKATCQPDRYALIEKDRIVNMRAEYL